jgi:hypothetical protein
MLQLKLDADEILALDGVGPKTMEEIETAIEAFEFPEPEVEEVEEVVEAEAEEAPEAELEAGEAPADEAEAVEAAEAEAEPTPEVEAAAEVEEAVEEEEEEEEEELTFEQALAESEITFIDDDFSDRIGQKDDKGGKKRKKYHQVEYDPDLDVNIVRRRRKRDSDEWDEDNWEDYLD